MLAHLISLEEDVMSAYKTVRSELNKYDKILSDKDEVVILTKKDTVDEKTLISKMKKIKKLNPKIFALSLYDDVSSKEVSDGLVKLLRKAD